jgi:hypothetical protein
MSAIGRDRLRLLGTTNLDRRFGEEVALSTTK